MGVSPLYRVGFGWAVVSYANKGEGKEKKAGIA